MAKTGTVAVDEPVAPASSGAGGLGSFVVRRRALLLGALVAVFALVVGYLGGLLEPRFTAPGDNSPEAGFAPAAGRVDGRRLPPVCGLLMLMGPRRDRYGQGCPGVGQRPAL